MPVRIRSEEGGESDHRALRILTQLVSLEPLGGIELCTVQDSEALAARGHSIDLMYGADGVFRPLMPVMPDHTETLCRPNPGTKSDQLAWPHWASVCSTRNATYPRSTPFSKPRPLEIS